MSKRILVAYASGSGSTREVAAAIGEAVAEEGAPVDVYAVQDVTSVADYSALVVGSSIRGGRWLPEAVDFVRRIRRCIWRRDQWPISPPVWP